MFRQAFTAALAALATLGSFTVATAQAPKAASGDNKITNSIGMKLTLVPPGEFKMGSGESAEETAAFFRKQYNTDFGAARFFKNEHPLHSVRITKPFYLGTYHVTRGQFRQFVNDTGYKTDAETPGRPMFGWDREKKRFECGYKNEYSWRNTGFEQTDEHPVVCVTWNDAVAFCKWLCKKEGKTYRLPTEAEWEYACRAGTTTHYYSGDDPETLAQVANVADSTFRSQCRWSNMAIKASDGYAFTSPVGKFKPNAFGLYDMHGNAMQWCADWYGEDYYVISPAEDPAGPDLGIDRVLRGGSWQSWSMEDCSAYRSRQRPNGSGFLFSLGFRVARTRDAAGNSASAPSYTPSVAGHAKGSANSIVKTQTPEKPTNGNAPKAIGGTNPIANSIGMKLSLIPSGEFIMGSREPVELVADYGNRSGDLFQSEHPLHRVRITKPFYLGTYHVTRGQFRQFVNDTGYKTDVEKKAKDLNEHKSWRDAGFEQTDEHPVVCVSWNDAVAFCDWLSKKEGKTYRLPTEAEWEYACRAGTTTRYYNGDDPEGLANVANVADATYKAKVPNAAAWGIKASDGYAFTSPVGRFKPNAFGLYDMHGNAIQWCADWYGGDYYEKSGVDDPKGPGMGSCRVCRGSCWGSGIVDARVARRYSWFSPDNGQGNDVGFRVARTQ